MKLFTTNDRSLAHQKLEEVLADGTFPSAFCTEDNNAAEVYIVMSGLEEPTEGQLAKADALVEQLKG